MKNLTLLLALGAGYLVYKSKTPGKTTNSEAKKSYFLDKDCRFVITNREQSLKWAYNQGKNFKKVDDDFKKLLFEDCLKGEIKLDTKESIIFYYDLFCNLISGYLASHGSKIDDLYKACVQIYRLYFTILGQLLGLKIKFNNSEIQKPVNFPVFKNFIANRGYTIANDELSITNENKFIDFGKNISIKITDFVDEDDNVENELNFYISVMTDASGLPKMSDKADYLVTYTFLKGQVANEQVTKENAQKALADTLADFNKDNIDTSNWPKDI